MHFTSIINPLITVLAIVASATSSSSPNIATEGSEQYCTSPEVFWGDRNKITATVQFCLKRTDFDDEATLIARVTDVGYVIQGSSGTSFLYADSQSPADFNVEMYDGDGHMLAETKTPITSRDTETDLGNVHFSPEKRETPIYDILYQQGGPHWPSPMYHISLRKNYTFFLEDYE